MFIKKITIKNFRLFKNFEIDNLNTPAPDNQAAGAGLTVLVGENASGKSSLLEALALPLLPLRAKNKIWDGYVNFAVGDNIRIDIFSQDRSEHVDVRISSVPFGQMQEVVRGPAFDSKPVAVNPIARVPNTDYHIEISAKDKNLDNVFVLFLDTQRDFRFSIEDGKADAYGYFIDRMNDSHFIKEGYSIIAHEHGWQALEDAIKKFEEISLWETEINLNSFFAFDKDNRTTNSYSNLGSGYQAIFHFLYFFCLARRSGVTFIALIDEPELHMHPELQEKFVKILLEFSQNAQIVIATHSPLLIKQLLQSPNVDYRNIRMLKRGEEDGMVSEVEKEERVLPYISANEINYVAFNLATEEYHNELYEGLNAKWEKKCRRSFGVENFDKKYFVDTKGEAKQFPWKGNPNRVSVHTFIRNQIHHRADNGAPDYDALKSSIDKMRRFWLEDYPVKK